jgi:hypothetical protein
MEVITSDNVRISISAEMTKISGLLREVDPSEPVPLEKVCADTF